MRIGTDELILWLRKNGKAIGVPNDGFGGLGQKIKVLLCDTLGGVKVQENVAVYRDDGDGSKNIGDFNLPKTAEHCRVRRQIVPFPKPSRDGTKTYPVILNFPVRAL